MSRPPIPEQISVNWQRIEDAPEFQTERIWLTLYVAGQRSSLEPLASGLAGEGWINVQDWDDGWTYPKLEVWKNIEEVTATALAAEQLCSAYGADLVAIDADTSPDVACSKFKVLYEAPAQSENPSPRP